MSARDPILQLADIVIRNYDDWRLIVMTMEPRHPGSIVKLPYGPTPQSSPVERFVMRRDQLIEILDLVGRVIDLSRRSRFIRRLIEYRYEQDLVYKEIADRLNCDEKTVRRKLDHLRRRVAGVLLNMGERRMSVFSPFFSR